MFVLFYPQDPTLVTSPRPPLTVKQLVKPGSSQYIPSGKGVVSPVFSYNIQPIPKTLHVE